MACCSSSSSSSPSRSCPTPHECQIRAMHAPPPTETGAARTHLNEEQLPRLVLQQWGEALPQGLQDGGAVGGHEEADRAVGL
jgi:hypothetical protein